MQGPNPGATLAIPNSAPATPPLPTPAPATPPPSAAYVPQRHWAVAAVTVVVGMFLGLLNSTIVNSALPALEKEFNATGVDAQWVSTSYRLALAASVPLGAWLGERFGLRRVYLAGLVLFAVTSTLCALSDGLWALVFFRALQAIPAGVLPVTCITLLIRMTSPARFTSAISVYALGIILAPAVSPLLGGALTEHLDWRLVFLVNAPIALVGALIALVVVPKLPVGPRRRLDWPGYLTLFVALAAPTLALSEASSWGWTSQRVLILLVVGANALLLFLAIELWVDQPLLNLSVFTRRPYVFALVMIQLLFGIMSVMLSYVPQFLQSAQGLTPTHTGLLLLPQAVCWLALVLVAAPATQRFGPAPIAILGYALIGAGSLMLTRITLDQSRFQLAVWTCLIGAGLGLAIVAVMSASVLSLPPELVGQGVMFRTAVQRVTAPFGISLLGSLVTAQHAQLLTDRASLMNYRGADADPRILGAIQHGSSALNGLAQQLNIMVTTQTYANVFLITGVGALLCAVAVVIFRWTHRPQHPS
jgi:EmrB/QacA subfamily drug resistance transporter